MENFRASITSHQGLKKKKNVQNSHITGPVTFETKLGDSWLIGQNPNLKTHAKGEQSCKWRETGLVHVGRQVNYISH